MPAPGCLLVSKEQLYNCCQKLQLNLAVLIMEIIKEAFKRIISDIDSFSILSNDPDHASPSLWLGQTSQ